MAAKKEVKPEVKPEVQEEKKSYQDELNEVDAQITNLLVKKKELAVLAAKEIKNKVEMPLHQLNMISTIGYKKAKEKCGENWVE